MFPTGSTGVGLGVEEGIAEGVGLQVGIVVGVGVEVVSGVAVTEGVGVTLGIGVTEGVGVTGVGVTLGVGVDGRRLTKTFIEPVEPLYPVALKARNNPHKAERIMIFNEFAIYIRSLSKILRLDYSQTKKF